MPNSDQKSSLNIFLLLVIPQAVILLMIGANFNMLASVLLVMASLWLQHNFAEKNHIRLSIIGAVILFIVYHFGYGFYLYNHNKNIENVCGVFSKYDTKDDFKSSRKVLILYQDAERKFYEFSYIKRLHENTNFFKTQYNPSEKLCIDYVKVPVLTMSYPAILKSVKRVEVKSDNNNN